MSPAWRSLRSPRIHAQFSTVWLFWSFHRQQHAVFSHTAQCQRKVLERSDCRHSFPPNEEHERKHEREHRWFKRTLTKMLIFCCRAPAAKRPLCLISFFQGSQTCSILLHALLFFHWSSSAAFSRITKEHAGDGKNNKKEPGMERGDKGAQRKREVKDTSQTANPWERRFN